MGSFRRSVAALLAAAFGAGAFAASARGEESDKATYTVGYIEVLPGQEKPARRLILDHVRVAKRAPGAVAIDAFVRDGYRNQFVLLEQWQSPKSRDDYGATVPAQQFRIRLSKLESAGVDERIQGPLFVESDHPVGTPPIVVMTARDIMPTE